MAEDPSAASRPVPSAPAGTSQGAGSAETGPVVLSSGIAEMFSLRRDLDDPDHIDSNVRSGVEVAGTNLWVLFFAILVASVGLNVGSTAVIIGAMLVSPLMGPIVGVGYGLAVHDMPLIRRALRNLGIFTVISLTTSTLYFTLSPLREINSELLARTSPTLWDVLIAFFGGAAGIVALTRKSIPNVVPGVAIATALMPPLCTAGFGLASGNWAYMGGAFYLFAINSVFIALATLAFLRLMHLPRRGALDVGTRWRARWVTGTIVAAMLLPSAYLAWRFVKDQGFGDLARAEIARMAQDERYLLLDREIDIARRRVLIMLGGEQPPADLGEQLQQRFAQAGFDEALVEVRFAGTERIDIGSLKRELREDVFAQIAREAEVLRERNAQLQEEARALREALQAAEIDHAQLLREIRAQQPQARSVVIALGQSQPGPADEPVPTLLVHLTQPGEASAAERERLQRWLAVRMPQTPVQVLFTRVR